MLRNIYKRFRCCKSFDKTKNVVGQQDDKEGGSIGSLTFGCGLWPIKSNKERSRWWIGTKMVRGADNDDIKRITLLCRYNVKDK